jgi:hypothetical protein
MKLTDYLALYAALLSTFVLFWNIRSSRPKFRVQMAFGVKQDGEKVTSGVHVSIQNISSQKVHISSMTILAPDRILSLTEKIKCAWKYRKFEFAGWVHHVGAMEEVETDLPKTIEPHGAHTVYIDGAVLAGVLERDGPRIFAVSVQDAHWKSRVSEPIRWARRAS